MLILPSIFTLDLQNKHVSLTVEGPSPQCFILNWDDWHLHCEVAEDYKTDSSTFAEIVF